MTTDLALQSGIRRDVVVVGASAGGLKSLQAFINVLPKDLPATVIVVLHLPASGSTALPGILSRAGCLPVRFAGLDEAMRHGEIVVAPPDHHVVVTDGRLSTTVGPRENAHRPAVDALFRTAARDCGPRVIAVVLSGALDDGTAGAIAVQQGGGVVLAQDPADAAYPSMPQSVVDHLPGTQIGTAAELGALVDRLTRSVVAVGVPHLPSAVVPVRSRRIGKQRVASISRRRSPELEFRTVAHTDAMKNALWMALQCLQEKVILNNRLAERAIERGSNLSAQRFLDRAQELQDSAELVKNLRDAAMVTGPRPDARSRLA